MGDKSNESSCVMELIGNLPRQFCVEGSLIAELADIICSEDFDAKLERLLERCGDLNAAYKNGQTILHHLAMTKPQLKYTGR